MDSNTIVFRGVRDPRFSWPVHSCQGSRLPELVGRVEAASCEPKDEQGQTNRVDEQGQVWHSDTNSTRSLLMNAPMKVLRKSPCPNVRPDPGFSGCLLNPEPAHVRRSASLDLDDNFALCPAGRHIRQCFCRLRERKDAINHRLDRT